jgi:hypothetical protein
MVEDQYTSIPEKHIGVGSAPFGGAVVTGMLLSERDKLIRESSAPEYRAEIRRLVRLGVAGPEDDEES